MVKDGQQLAEKRQMVHRRMLNLTVIVQVHGCKLSFCMQTFEW